MKAYIFKSFIWNPLRILMEVEQLIPAMLCLPSDCPVVSLCCNIRTLVDFYRAWIINYDLDKRVNRLLCKKSPNLSLGSRRWPFVRHTYDNTASVKTKCIFFIALASIWPGLLRLNTLHTITLLLLWGHSWTAWLPPNSTPIHPLHSPAHSAPAQTGTLG